MVGTRLSFLLGAFAVVVAPARAADAGGESALSRNPLRETGREGDHLTANWRGARDWLVSRGVHFQLGYIGEGLANLSGGIRSGARQAGLGELALELDLERFTRCWKGGSLRVSALWLHGHSPSKDLIGDSLAASNIDGHDSVRLYEWWLQQELPGDRLSIRAGSLLADKEFAGTDSGGVLLNSAFGWPAFISGNVLNTGPAFYASAPGIRVRAEAGDRWYFQSGVFDGDSFDSASGNPRVNESGTHFALHSRQGALVLNELGFRANPSKDSAGLPGTFKLGVWAHSADFQDNTRAGRGHDGNFGAYFAAEQMLWRAETNGHCGSLSAFFRAGGAPPDRSAFAFVIDAGFCHTGLLPGRAEDRLAVGFVHADIAGAGRSYAAFSSHEQAVEATYSAVVTPWWSLQPDVQWIHHPGGRHGFEDALVLGLRTTLTF